VEVRRHRSNSGVDCGTKMHVIVEIICIAVLSLFILCEAQTGKKWPDEVIAPPYHLLSVRAEKYILPLLPYDLGDLEPYIDRETVVAHYEGHHEAYRRKMNVALNDWREDVGLTGVICFLLLTCTCTSLALAADIR